jgi:hypothetical protein
MIDPGMREKMAPVMINTFQIDGTFNVSTLNGGSIRLSSVFPSQPIPPLVRPLHLFCQRQSAGRHQKGFLGQHEAKRYREKRTPVQSLPTQLCNIYEIGVIYRLIQTRARLPLSTYRSVLSLNLTVFLVVQTNESDLFKPSCSPRPAWPSSAPQSPGFGRRHHERTWRSLAS